jgi:2-oxoglutarate dehydrogenase E2 component (dihydrolipoamide succinyltransferase)
MAELVDIVAPESDEEGTEAILETWLKQEGEEVELNEPILEIATDKVTLEVPSPVCGVLREILVQPGDTVESGMILGRMEHQPRSHEEDISTDATGKEDSPVRESIAAQEKTEARLSPAVRKLIREHSLDPVLIPGSGRGSRVTVRDVESYLERLDTEERKPAGPDFREELIPHTQMRLQIADHMIMSALETAPHVTAVFECDMSRVVAHRERHKADYEQRGSKLTYTAYFVCACVEACRHVPTVNGRWTEEGLQLFDHCNVGVATALEGQGLIVPVIKNAQDHDLFGITEKLNDLAERARTKKLAISDVQDGTISITNHGVSGSIIGTPIINQPQNAIVGIGKIVKRPVVAELAGGEEIHIRPIIYVTLTIDHRAIDGHTANHWLSVFVSTLEQW